VNIEALHEYMRAAASRQFRLGGYDCVRFVAESLLVGWNKDYLAALGYTDRRTVVRRLRGDGGLASACDKVLGRRIRWSDLETGDVAFFDDPRATIGLHMGAYVAVKMGGQIARVEPTWIDFGWRP